VVVRLAAGSSRTVVEVETSEGLIGLGEAASYAAADIINRAIAPKLIGRDPIDIAGAELLCLPSWRGVSTSIDFGLIRAFAAVETALWDIRGKAWSRPLYDLLGGAVRKDIPFTDYFGFRERNGNVGGEKNAGSRRRLLRDAEGKFWHHLFRGKIRDSRPGPEHRHDAKAARGAGTLGHAADRRQHGLFGDGGNPHRSRNRGARHQKF